MSHKAAKLENLSSGKGREGIKNQSISIQIGRDGLVLFSEVEVGVHPHLTRPQPGQSTPAPGNARGR